MVRSRSSGRTFGIALLLAGSLLAVSAVGDLAGRGVAIPGPQTKAASGPPMARPAAYNLSTVYYHSSVDNFLLSYYETIPSPFNNSQSHPLAVELHGLTGETLPVSGGTGGYVAASTALAAAQDGFILININTRTGSGWYVNSNYTGPQEQDILDAIAHEKVHRQVSAVYLFGTSMGSIGTLSIGLDHPKLFKGLGVVASFTDYFEMYAFMALNFSTWLAPWMLLPTGGLLPNASAYAHGIFMHLSPLRFHPENMSGLRFYMANGKIDALATNNQSVWGYQQANNTIVNRTCLVATQYAEPANCTTPLSTLAAEHPSKFHYRYIYEPNGPHSYYLLNASDMFAYFLGGAADGTYWGTYPIPSPVNPSVPLVSVAIEPTSCGSVTIGATTAVSGDALELSPGNYSISFTPCAHQSLHSVRAAGGVSYVRTGHLLVVTRSGSVLVTF
ncbi:MAG: hypothetical protein ACHQ2Y_02715 [Candidatus Lutacidiplasmatales archaeon]